MPEFSKILAAIIFLSPVNGWAASGWAEHVNIDRPGGDIGGGFATESWEESTYEVPQRLIKRKSMSEAQYPSSCHRSNRNKGRRYSDSGADIISRFWIRR